MEGDLKKPPPPPPPSGAAEASSAPQKYYALRKCPGLDSPALFLSLPDVQKQLMNLTNQERDTVEYGEFDRVVEAVKFIHEPEEERDINSLRRPPPPLTMTSVAAPAAAVQSRRLDPELESRLASYDDSVKKNLTKKRARAPLEMSFGGYETATKKVKGTTIRIISNKPRNMSQREKEWEENYRLLLRFKQVYGDCHVPTVPDHPRITPEFQALPGWVKTVQRQLDKLENGEDDEDEDGGDDSAPKGVNADGTSPKPARKKYRKLMNEERKQRLEAIGFRAESIMGIKWDKSFEILKRFKETHGDCAVPTSATHPRILAHEDFKTLIKFVRKIKDQLKEYEKDPSSCKVMNAERRQQLVNIGFLGDSDDGKGIALRDKNWEEKFDLLKEYKLRFGSCDIPQNPKHQRFLEPGNEKFKPLISWVQKTRELLDKFEKDPTQKNLMNADRKQRLLDVGFLVKPVRKAGQKFSNDEQLFATRERKYNERFEEMFAKLKEYKAEHGHVNIPLRPNNPVRNWLMTQRSMYEQSLSGKKVPLTLQKMAQLQAVGFQFVPPNKKKTTAERIEDWIEFRRRHGRDPKSKSADREEHKLAGWGMKMREKYHLYTQGITKHPKIKVDLTPEIIERMRANGFRWEAKKIATSRAPKVPWEQRYQELIAYKKETGNCRPPRSYEGLGEWCHTQRREYKNLLDNRVSCMTMERVRLLTEVGFFIPANTTGTLPKASVGMRVPGVPGYDDDDESSDGGVDQGAYQQQRAPVPGNYRAPPYNRVDW